jgi:hypothetical protein
MPEKTTPVNTQPTVDNTPKQAASPKKETLAKPKKKSSKAANKAPKDFDMLKAIRAEKDYKSNVKRRDVNSRKYIEENLKVEGRTSVMPGQLIMFNYFEPATKDKLEYYDAMPCTIFFGIVNTQNGKRVIGFNIHYYPPRIRFQLMNRIYEIFKPIYSTQFSTPLSEEMSYFNYKMLISQLQKAKLDFGIREYIPNLMAHIVPVPVADWPKAVLTEGHFRKETREQILNYWKNKTSGIDKPKKKKE